MSDWRNEVKRSWKRLCSDFEQHRFYPESENDITSYLYYSLVAYEGLDKDFVHTEYTLRTRERSHRSDMVIGRPLFRTSEDYRDASPRLHIEIKLWKSSLTYYLGYVTDYGKKFVEKDFLKLIRVRQRFEQLGRPVMKRGMLALFFRKMPPYVAETPGLIQKWNNLARHLKRIERELISQDIELLIGPHYERESTL